jgi:hypothetical protein
MQRTLIDMLERGASSLPDATLSSCLWEPCSYLADALGVKQHVPSGCQDAGVCALAPADVFRAATRAV